MGNSNLTASCTYQTVEASNCNSICFECSLDQRFAMSGLTAKFEVGLNSSLTLVPSFQYSVGCLTNVLKKTDKEQSIYKKNCCKYLFYSSFDGVIPQSYISGFDYELNVNGKNDIEFIAGDKKNIASKLDTADTIACLAGAVVSAAGMIAGSAATFFKGNTSIVGIVGSTVAILAAGAAATSSVISLGKKIITNEEKNPLEQKLDALEGNTRSYDIGSYTDGNLNLTYGQKFSAKTEKSELSADHENKSIRISADSKLVLAVDSKPAVSADDNSITITSGNTSISMTNSKIELKCAQFSMIVDNNKIQIGNKIKFNSSGVNCQSMSIGRNKLSFG
jgi:hypothetical protein